MLSGFYTAGSGILMQQRAINVLTNNMVNAQTPGFRAERVISTTFEQEFMTRKELGNTGTIGKGSPIRIVEDVPTLFDPAALKETGRPFDLAINGEGFFSIRPFDKEGEDVKAEQTQSAVVAKKPEAEQYLTRNGNFDIDDDGYLILRGVGRVQGKNGDIMLGTSNFDVSKEGIITSNGKTIDTVKLLKVTDRSTLEKATNGLYYPVADQEGNVPDEEIITNFSETVLEQGVTERSNVDLNREMTLVMEAQRAFQSCSQALKMLDQINQKTATQIAAL